MLLSTCRPSVSKTLRHAESILGFPLFERSAGRLVATDDAHALFAEVSEIQDRVHALREGARNLRQPENRAADEGERQHRSTHQHSTGFRRRRPDA